MEKYETMYGYVWNGTVAQMKEWLNQFDDDDTITFEGSAGEEGIGILTVSINEQNQIQIIS